MLLKFGIITSVDARYWFDVTGRYAELGGFSTDNEQQIETLLNNYKSLLL